MKGLKLAFRRSADGDPNQTHYTILTSPAVVTYANAFLQP